MLGAAVVSTTVTSVSFSGANEPNPKSKASSSPSPVSQCPMFRTLLGLTTGTATGATATKGGVDEIGSGNKSGSGSGTEATEMAPTGEGCEMSTEGCCCDDSAESRMGSHPDALIFAPFTEGGRTLSNVDTPKESSGSGTVLSGSGSKGKKAGSSTTGNGCDSSGTTSGAAGSGSTTSSGTSAGVDIAAGCAMGFLSAKIKCAPPLEPQTFPIDTIGVGANGAGEDGRPDGVGSSREIMFTARPPERSTGISSSGSKTGEVSSGGG
mmetsp:Transcript_6245/g.11187  ORF Transcript_6245/g.11187 Transcript_6245/m.11187 type:complete len:266 (+) Transcript_6245:1701-2498(+)